MRPELDLLDQLLAEDMPLNEVAAIFPDLEHCKYAVRQMLECGDVRLVDGSGEVLPSWRWPELGSDGPWQPGTSFRLSLTDIGASQV